MRAFVRIVLPALFVVSLFAVPTAAIESTATEPLATVTELPTEPPAPVYENLTFYLHGVERVGEADASTLASMRMDTTAPTATETASRQVLNYVRGPNTKCSGSWLFPSWDGEMDGQVQGNVKVTLDALSHPNNSFVVELFADGAGACNEAYVPPVASKTVSFPVGSQGTTEIVFENVDFTVGGQLTLMVRPPDGPTVTPPPPPDPQVPPAPSQSTLEPHQGRVFYDSTSVQSRIELQCLLPEGKTSCLF